MNDKMIESVHWMTKWLRQNYIKPNWIEKVNRIKKLIDWQIDCKN